jgi:hypothetical protein
LERSALQVRPVRILKEAWGRNALSVITKKPATDWLAFALFLVVLGAVLLPFLGTRFYFDDSVNCRLHDMWVRQGLGIFRGPLSFIEGVILREGRFYPVGLFLIFGAWESLFHQLLVYRVVHVLLIALNIVMWLGIQKAWGIDLSKRLVAGVLLLACLQTRAFPDPISAYAGMLQQVMLFGFGAILALAAWFRKPERERGALVLLLLLLGLLTYEISTVFVPVVALALFFPKLLAPSDSTASLRQSHRLGMMVVGLALAYVALSLLLRSLYQPEYGGIIVRLSENSIRAYLVQLFGAVPGSWPLFARSGLFSAKTLIEPPFISLMSLVALAAGGGLLLRLLGASSPRPAVVKHRFLDFLATALTFGPPLFIAISSKWQTEVSRIGWAYIPVYAQYFGMAWWLTRLVERTSRGAPVRRWMLAGVVGFLCMLTVASNRITIAALNQEYPSCWVGRDQRYLPD